MSLKMTPTARAIQGLHPEVVKNRALGAPSINAGMQWMKRSTDRLLKLLQGTPEVRQASHFQLEPRHRASNWIYVDTDDSCA